MSDEFDILFQRLRGQRPPRPFAAPEVVRRRGRQRSRHQAVAAGLAVAAMAGGGGAGLASVASINRSVTPSPTSTAPSATPTTVPLPSAAPSPSSSPTPDPSTALPKPGDLRSRMLRAEDLGPGSWQSRPPYEPFEGDLWAWDQSAECSAYRSADYPSLRQHADLVYTGWGIGETTGVAEHVHRYRPGWGPRAVDDVRRVLATCPGATPPPSTPGGAVPSRLTVVDTDFAGDESLLIRNEAWSYLSETTIEPYVTLIAVVRVGDLVATVLFSPDRDEAYAKSVAGAAAQRLAGG